MSKVCFKCFAALYLVTAIFITSSAFALSDTDLVAYSRGKTCPPVNAWSKRWSCKKISCKKIKSCEQAFYHMIACGHIRRDGDADGVPCEKLCEGFNEEPKVKYRWNKKLRNSCKSKHQN